MSERFTEWLRRGFSTLAASPGFFLGAVLILGIATGGLVATGTAAWSILLKPLPFERPDSLVAISTYAPRLGFQTGFSRGMTRHLSESGILAATGVYEPARTIRDRDGQTWRAARIGHDLAAMLGVRPVAGRGFHPEDVEPGAAPVVLIGERAWRRRLAAAGTLDEFAPATLELADGPVRIVGVMPEHFTVPELATELWRPLATAPEDLDPQAYAAMTDLRVIGRLASGRSPAATRAAVEALYAADERLAVFREVAGMEVRVTGLRASWRGDQQRTVMLVNLVAALVFLTALLNLAGLWMARWLGRAPEIAVRLALGAGVRRALAGAAGEFALVAAGGGALGLLVAAGGIRALYAAELLERTSPLPVAAGPASVALAIVILAGAALPVLLAIAWQTRALESRCARLLVSGGSTARTVGRRTRKILVAGQLAAACGLLAVAALLLQSWIGLLKAEVGFEPRRLVLAEILPPADSKDGGLSRDPSLAPTLERLAALPGVEAVAFTNLAPFGYAEMLSNYEPPDAPGSQAPMRPRYVSEGFFELIGQPLVAGHAFSADHASGPPRKVVVDELFAGTHFPESGAVGGRFRFGVGPDGALEGAREAEIIGVVATSKHMSPGETVSHPTVYEYLADPSAHSHVLLRTRLAPSELIQPVRRVLVEEVGAARTGNVITLQSLILRTIAERRPQLHLAVALAVLSAALAAVGLFAVLSYNARARMPEFGLRMAMGAAPGWVGLLVVADGLKLLAWGLIPGIVLAWLGGHLVAGQLYRVEPLAPSIWLAIAALLALAVLAAGTRPALSAMRIEPMDALRQE